MFFLFIKVIGVFHGNTLHGETQVTLIGSLVIPLKVLYLFYGKNKLSETNVYISKIKQA